MKERMCFVIKYIDAWFDGNSWYSNEEFEIKTVYVKSDDEIISILSELMERQYGYQTEEYEICNYSNTIECFVKSSNDADCFDKPVICADFIE